MVKVVGWLVLLACAIAAWWFVWPTSRAYLERPASSMTIGDVVLIATLAVAFLRRPHN